MYKRLLRIWLLTIGALLSQPVCAQLQEVIWISSSEPDKPLIKGVDNIDLPYHTFQMIFRYLPEYQPVFKAQNTLRAFRELEQKPNVCTDGKVKKESRLEMGYVTEFPQLIKLGLQLVARADEPRIRQFSPRDSVNLSEVITSSPELSLALVAGRSYGMNMDNTLESMKGNQQIWYRSSEYGINGGLALLLKNRVKLTLEYPSAVNRMLKNTPGGPELKLWTLNGADEYQRGYIFCSKSEFGKKMAARLSAAIKTASQTQDYLEAHLKYTPKPLKPKLLRYYNQVYRTDF